MNGLNSKGMDQDGTGNQEMDSLPTMKFRRVVRELMSLLHWRQPAEFDADERPSCKPGLSSPVTCCAASEL